MTELAPPAGRAPVCKGAGARRAWPRRLRLGAVALAGAAGVAALVGACPRPDFAAVAEPAGSLEREVPLPALWLPAVDVEAGNGLEAVFVHVVAPGRAEVTLVFHDEDQPFAPFDLAYDGYRWLEYGRVADVETFAVRYEPPVAGDAGRPGTLIALDLDDVYAGDQPFAVPMAEHHSARIDAADLARAADGRSILYVTTWNHMMRERDGEPAVVKRPAEPAPVYRGDRAAVERLFAKARAGT